MKKLNCSDAKTISIVDFLAQIGFHPVKQVKNDFYYLSPFRTENHPSFRVNTSLNVFFDYGTGEGGTIIDLGTKLLNCSIAELLEKLSSQRLSTAHRPIKSEIGAIQIKEKRALSNTALMYYIKERSIDIQIARKYCHEVSFLNGERNYFAIGFQNNSGGFELRNKYFKGCSTPKDITHIKNSSPTLCVFEGFFDFLSYFGSRFEMETCDFLILNTLSFIDKGIVIMKNYNSVHLFLDNDNAGRSASAKIMNSGIKECVDLAGEYKLFNDLNDFKMNETRLKKTAQNNIPNM